MRRLTHLDAGVSGITALSPALGRCGRQQNRLHRLRGRANRDLFHRVAGGVERGAVESTVAEDIPAAALLPPAMRTNELVSAALADAITGLPAAVADLTPTARLGLNAVSQPYVSAGYGPYGGMFGGGIAFSFGDMLGNHNLRRRGCEHVWRLQRSPSQYRRHRRLHEPDESLELGRQRRPIPFLTGYTGRSRDHHRVCRAGSDLPSDVSRGRWPRLISAEHRAPSGAGGRLPDDLVRPADTHESAIRAAGSSSDEIPSARPLARRCRCPPRQPLWYTTRRCSARRARCRVSGRVSR